MTTLNFPISPALNDEYSFGDSTWTWDGSAWTIKTALQASDFGTQATNTVLAAPSDSTGLPSFRTLQVSDVPVLNQNTTGNAATATALETARTINGVSFNGTANITVADATKQPLDADLTAIADLTGTSGLLRKTAANTWSLDNNAYVTSSGVTSVSGTAPIVSSGGTTPAISITAATTIAAGSMSAADKTKLDGIAAGAQVNVATNLTYTAATTTGTVNSSTGTNATIPAATTSLAGLMTNADKTKLDGIATNANNYSLPKATATLRGGVELASDTVQTVAANAVSTTASRTYGIQLNSADQMVVNVPWSDTNTTYSKATATSLGLVELGSDTVQTVAANAVSDTASRSYAVQLNSADQMVVNVPWSDTNTTYSASKGVSLSGTDFRITGNEIPGSVDLNTYRTTGYYTQNSNADASSGSNYPNAAAGILQVINDDHGNGLHTTQLYSQYNTTDYYHRTYYNGAWSSWRNLAQDTNTTYGTATSTVQGLIELFSDATQTVAANAVSATASRTYGIQLNSSGQAVVNVPWSDTNTTYSKATATSLGLVELGSDTVQTVAANAVSTTASRSYAVQLNSDDQMVVNVPWSDTNTTYSEITEAEVIGSTSSTARLITGRRMKYAFDNITANKANELANARTINGVSFDGSANITVADSTKLPLAGGAMTGPITGTDASADAGALTVRGGNSSSSGVGGALSISGGNTVSTTAGKNGGTVTVKAGDNTSASGGLGGLLELGGGAAVLGTGGQSRLYSGDSKGTNRAGSDLMLFAGKGTGTGVGGTFRIYTSGTTTSGTGLQTSTSRFEINNVGQISALANIASSSTTTGTLKVTGGVGVSGTVYAAGFNGALTGNASTATTLQNARTLTIGNTGKTFNGSANVAWSLAEIGAQAAGNYVTVDTTQTITGAKTFTQPITHNTTSTRDKYRVWGDSNYVIGMQSNITFGAINNDYAMTFQMNNADGRGFWWGDASHTAAQGAMSLSTNGNLTVARGIRVGGGESDTSVPTLPFEVVGTSGQLFSVTDSMSGTIFSVNDISGIPSIEVIDTGLVKIAEYSGNVVLGSATDNGTDKLQVTGSISSTGNITAPSFVGNASTATTLQTARTIGGVSFNGSANINLPGVNTAGNQSTSGNAATATTLQTARTINGTSFNGSANITTTNWGTARTLTVGNTGKSVNGSANVSWSLAEIGAYAATNPSGYTSNTGTVTSVGGTGGYGGLTLSGTVTTSGNLTLGGTPTGTWPISVSGNAATASSTPNPTFSADAVGKDNITTRTETGFYESSSGTIAEGWPTDSGSWHHLIASTHSNDGNYYSLQLSSTFFDQQLYFRATNGSGSTAWNTVLHNNNYNTYAPTKTGTGASGTWGISITGNAATATALQTARTINGTSFNGSANITTANWGTARTLTVGNTGKSVNGSANVAWSLAEIGAAAVAHDHDRNFITDSRGAARAPSYYDDRYAQWDFQNTSDTGAGGDAWHGLLTVAKWSVYDPSHRQEQLAFTGDDLKRRTATSDSAWGSWKVVLDSSNYNTYAPTKTGTGASGTWGISVTGSSASTTGNAATATKLATARTINGVSFNGTANITITAAANGGTSSAVTVNNSDANSTYRMLWHSGNNVYSTAGIYCNPSTDILYASQVQATSDESVKTNWRSVEPDFVNKLANTKSGIYDRTDIELTQAGVSAQSWQNVLPETVLVNKESGLLSVNYANAALVSAVELAKKVVSLEERLAKLESLIKN